MHQTCQLYDGEDQDRPCTRPVSGMTVRMPPAQPHPLYKTQIRQDEILDDMNSDQIRQGKIKHCIHTRFVCFCLLKAYSPANRTGSPQGFCETRTLHKIYKHNPKVSPFGIALIKKMAIKLGDAGTIDHFGLVFQYMIKNIFEKEWTKAIAN